MNQAAIRAKTMTSHVLCEVSEIIIATDMMHSGMRIPKIMFSTFMALLLYLKTVIVKIPVAVARITLTLTLDGDDRQHLSLNAYEELFIQVHHPRLEQVDKVLAGHDVTP
jgi:hypothetical protein